MKIQMTIGVDLHKCQLNMVVLDQDGRILERREMATKCRKKIAEYFGSYGESNGDDRREQWQQDKSRSHAENVIDSALVRKQNVTLHIIPPCPLSAIPISPLTSMIITGR